MKLDYIQVVVVLGIFAVMVGLIIHYETTDVQVEGEVIGKEPRQQAFLGGTPNFLIINESGKIQTDAETFHSYEVGDTFNESVRLSQTGSGYEVMDFITALLPVWIIVVCLAIFSAVWRGPFQ